MTIIDDMREYIFPIFSVQSSGNEISIQSRIFLGTGFFVSKNGDALTANHVIPAPEAIEQGHRLIAIFMHDGVETICWINKALKFNNFDLALIEINIDNTKYFNLSSEELNSGEDIQTIGFPSHERNGAGKEMRVFKGHITLSHKMIELNFPIPAGMSGSPIFKGDRVVAIATGEASTEELLDESQEIQLISNQKEIIEITEIKKMIYYGIALPFSKIKLITDQALEGKTIFDFLTHSNSI